MELGADDFLVKPVSLQDLLNCVEARLKRAQIHWRVEDRTLAKLRSTMHSNLPHEFFTPLAGIIGLSEIVRSDFAKLSADELKDIHKDIYGSALRLNRTLKNYVLMLDLQATETETFPPRLLAPEEVEKSLRFGLRSSIRRNGRKDDIVVQVVPCSLRVSDADLSLIVEELVDNACKFSRQGTPVTVSLSRDGMLAVSDKGRGMSPEETKQIGPFQQFDRKRYEQQGLGLGLVLVQKLLARIGATFSIKSQLTEGTEIRIAFATTVED